MSGRSRVWRAASVGVGTLDDVTPLRGNVLGWNPLTIDGDAADTARHVVARSGRDVVGCGSAGLQNIRGRRGTGVRFWGVAVTEDHQGAGVGSAVLAGLLDYARTLGGDYVWANARTTAVSFYTSRGFQALGEPLTNSLTGLADNRVVYAFG